MTQQPGFFDAQVTDSFVEGLDDMTYSQLVTVLRDNFSN